MMTDEQWAEAEARADRISDLKKELSVSIRGEGVDAYPWEIEGDILVSGPLSVIVEWATNWRSEIEELGA